MRTPKSPNHSHFFNWCTTHFPGCKTKATSKKLRLQATLENGFSDEKSDTILNADIVLQVIFRLPFYGYMLVFTINVYQTKVN